LSKTDWYWIILANSGVALISVSIVFFCLKPNPVNAGYLIEEFSVKAKKYQRILRKAKRTDSEINS